MLPKVKRHITFTTPAPKEMAEQFNKTVAIRKYVELTEDGLSPWERAVTLEYAEAITKFELAKFAYESLGKEWGDKVKYSHEIACDGKTVEIVRYGKESPGILETMNMNYNINI